eukprot:1321306-Rhodomonas_salina.2
MAAALRSLGAAYRRFDFEEESIGSACRVTCRDSACIEQVSAGSADARRLQGGKMLLSLQRSAWHLNGKTEIGGFPLSYAKLWPHFEALASLDGLVRFRQKVFWIGLFWY